MNLIALLLEKKIFGKNACSQEPCCRCDGRSQDSSMLRKEGVREDFGYRDVPLTKVAQ